MKDPARRNRALVPARDPRGFVLVGVAMFIIVLTILALSLFSLSGFESQFLERSLSGSQASYNAMGGLDRARWVLETTDKLEDVKDNLPPGVIWSGAYQGASLDSTGGVQWNGVEDVTIRVTGDYRGVQRTIEARFIPTQPTDAYKRLMTLSDPVQGLKVWRCNTDWPTCDEERWSQTLLGGRMWLNTPQPVYPWGEFQQILYVTGFETPGGVPHPDLEPYFYGPSGHWSAAQDVSPAPGTLDFTLTGSPVGFYRTPHTSGDWSMQVDAAQPQFNVTVSGTAIWMFDQGLYTEQMIRVQGLPTDLLVLVARSGSSPLLPNTGLALLASVDSPAVPVILIAANKIRLMHEVNPTVSSTISYLSMYARVAEIKGPSPSLLPPCLMSLLHPTNAAQDAVGTGVVDALCQLGLLPNIAPGSARQLSMRLGSWYQVPASN